jgi:hypothetical protein
MLPEQPNGFFQGLTLCVRKGYRSAIEWIKQQIDSNQVYLRDDTRFWVDVTPI